MNFNLLPKDSVLSPRDKQQRLMLGVLLVLILAILFVLYLNLWRPLPEPFSKPSDSAGLSVAGGTGAAPGALIEKIDFDTDFLKSSRFKDLKVYGEWPLETDEKGRANPFLPY